VSEETASVPVPTAVPDGADLERAVSQVRAIVDLLDANGVSRLRLRWGALDLELERTPEAGARRPAAASTVNEAPAEMASTAVPVRAPLVGVFYRSRAPENRPFVEVGQRVEAGQQVAVVEAMKMFNPITTAVAGTVMDIPAGNGEIVEFDQVLVMVQP